MKQNFLKRLMTALLLFCCTVANAQSFEVDGIYYNILSEEDKTVEVTNGSSQYIGAVTIPESVIYNSINYSVTSIGERAFYGCSGLTSIEIPNSVTSIGESVFYACTGLTSIEIPNSVTSIGESVFYGCSTLTSVTISNSVTSIEYATFAFTALTSVEIPNSVISIGNYVFYNCSNLTNLEIPNSVTSIGNYAFRGCSGLTSIEIPNSVTSIGNWAFGYCKGLTSIEIPNSVTSIEYAAFTYCDGLTSIISHIPADKLFTPGEYAFHNVDKEACILYVPSCAKEAYAATDGWSDFTNIVEAYSLTVSAAGYATMYLDYAAEIPEGVEVYTADRIEGDRLKMQPVEDVIPANTGVIVRANEGTYSFVESDETPAAVSGNLLTGTVADTYVKPAAATAYVLSQVDGVVGMYRAKLKADGTFKNNANKAYMLLGDITTGEGNLDTNNPGGQLSNGYRFDFGGTTAIESVETESAAPAVYYDLSGRRVENPVKGIYIVNGRKVFVK